MNSDKLLSRTASGRQHEHPRILSQQEEARKRNGRTYGHRRRRWISGSSDRRRTLLSTTVSPHLLPPWRRTTAATSMLTSLARLSCSYVLGHEGKSASPIPSSSSPGLFSPPFFSSAWRVDAVLLHAIRGCISLASSARSRVAVMSPESNDCDARWCEKWRLFRVWIACDDAAAEI